MDNVFEEWDFYSLKKQLKPRAADFDGMIANSKIKIVAITGIRRSGKSSLLMLLRQSLEKAGKKSVYVYLEDGRIKNRDNVLDELIKEFGDNGFLLLDEITSIPAWESWLARNHELLKGKLSIITSSSRKNLIVPKKPLRGRILPYEMYPLSFSEFLKFNDIKIENTTAGLGITEKALNEYLIYGGFPEVALAENKVDKIKFLNSYFKDIIGLDVADISKEDVSTVELFGKYIIEAPLFSASKCLNFMKSAGYKIGKQSILNLEKYAQESYLFFFVHIFSYSLKDRSQYPRKAYLGDTGFMNAVSGKTDLGRLFENAVFLELKRRLGPSSEINYWKNAQGIEVDFVIREGLAVKELIQVVYDLKNGKTKEREIKGLTECAKEFSFKQGTIITRDYEGMETVGGVRIKYIPLWKWLIRE